MSRPLLALTLIRPWSDAIVRGPKRVENRGWSPFMVDVWIAIHAGAKYDGDCVEWGMPDEDYRPPPERDSLRGIVGVARVVGALDTRGGQRRVQWGAFADRNRVAAIDSDPWWAGPVGWLLDDVVAIEPVPCRGALGLWRLPASVELEVRRRWEEARR